MNQFRRKITTYWAIAGAALVGLAQAPGSADAHPLSGSSASPTLRGAPMNPGNDDSSLTEAKSLYASGRYVEALGKFTTLLRNDPQNAEAREYLRLIVDEMKKPAAVNSGKKNSKAIAPRSASALPDDTRKRLAKRFLLTLDLNVIPNVRVIQRDSGAQAELPSQFLFGDKSAGLKEQGIPMLDRTAAWLRTFDQPIIIHLFPEELEDPGKNGGLFVQRYAELYNFFVEERRLNASRFISAEDLHTDGVAKKDELDHAPSKPTVIIEVVGNDFPFLEGLIPPGQLSSPFLEQSIIAQPGAFDPLEGEWTNLDLAALARMGVQKWSLTVTPETAPEKTLFEAKGGGNVLKRVSWDGRDQKTGNFVDPGNYTATLAATNNDGVAVTKEARLIIHHGDSVAPIVAPKPTKPSPKKAHVKLSKKPARAGHAKKVTARISKPSHDESLDPASATDRSEVANVPATRATVQPSAGAEETAPSDETGSAKADSSAVPPSPAASETGAATASAGADATGDSVHAIWKQVIEFDPGQSDIKPSLKASLERIGKTLEVYPLQKVRILGFASASEPKAAELAKKRAEVVRNVLVEQYHVDRKRVVVAGSQTTASVDGSKVELSITN